MRYPGRDQRRSKTFFFREKGAGRFFSEEYQERLRGHTFFTKTQLRYPVKFAGILRPSTKILKKTETPTKIFPSANMKTIEIVLMIFMLMHGRQQAIYCEKTESKLIQHLLNGHDKNSRPVYEKKTAVNVSVGLRLYQVINGEYSSRMLSPGGEKNKL